jgi:hypothetical protein
MNFKKPKHQLLEEARQAAESQVRNTLTSGLPGMTMDSYSVSGVFARAISMGISEAVRVVIDNTYTDQEFEEDMDLRSKSEHKQ